MINTKELEKRWFRYKAKGLILIFSIFAIFFLLLYGGYYILYKLDLDSRDDMIKEKREVEIEVIEEIPEINFTKPSILDEIIDIEEIEESEDILLSPTIPIVDLDDEKKNKQHRSRKKVVYRQKEPKNHHKDKKATYLTVKELTVVNGHSSKSVEKKKINLHKSSNNYLSIMKDKFQQNKNPREALLIAQAYYRAGNYENSEKWALKANNLDKNLDESWLLFASSQERLGRREEALKILLTYYRRSKSPKAKALIEKMRTKSI
jgi:tetratricopeptide (TPR) repeat protein